ncbi:MAG: insulinase family protein [Neomegalonema sp.]|nr:insulinase family protein [Neomegalonema sp.]
MRVYSALLRRTIFLRSAMAVAALGLAVLGSAVSGSDARATEIQRVVSPGGIEAWLVEERSIPIVSIELGFPGGASLEGPEQAGLATLMMGLLEEGAGDLDATGFAAATEQTAARFGFSASRDGVRVSASMLKERQAESLDLLKLAIHQPRFDADAVDRVKAQMISNIRQSETEPSAIASRAFFAALFPDDPYGRDSDGTEATVSSFSPDMLHAAKDRFLNRRGLKIGVVGAISPEELGTVLDDLLGALPVEGPSLPEKPSLHVTGGVKVIDFPAPQSQILFGHTGLDRHDPDFIPAYVMNYILGGGGFSSRLMEEVREKRGLAYGAYAYLANLDRAALYMGSTATVNPRVSESISVIRAEWEKLARDGVSAQELDKAKKYLTGAFPLRFDSNGKIANFLVGAQLDGLPIDYIETRNDLVEAVTLEDIQRVAQRLIQPEQLFFVVVGQPAGVESTL